MWLRLGPWNAAAVHHGGQEWRAYLADWRPDGARWRGADGGDDGQAGEAAGLDRGQPPSPTRLCARHRGDEPEARDRPELWSRQALRGVPLRGVRRALRQDLPRVLGRCGQAGQRMRAVIPSFDLI